MSAGAGAVALAAAALLAGCGAAAPAPLPEVVQVVVPHGPVERDVATGFAVGDGRLVTVAHVLGADARRTRVLAGARPVRVLAVDGRDDVALLAAHRLSGRAARLGAGAPGPARVLVLRDGRVVALRARIVRAIVARIRTPVGRRIVRRPALELRAAIRPGDSGAPVLAPDGRVVGMVFAQADGRSGVAYAVAASGLAGSLRWHNRAP